MYGDGTKTEINHFLCVQQPEINHVLILITILKCGCKIYLFQPQRLCFICKKKIYIYISELFTNNKDKRR